MYLVCRSIIIYNIDTNVQNLFSTRYINIYKYYVIIVIIILYILVHIKIYLLCQSIAICYIDTEEQDPIIIVYAINPLF